MHDWSAFDVDDVVLHGHQLYEDILVTQHTQGLQTTQQPRYLGQWEIPNEVLFKGREFRTTSYFDIFFFLVSFNNNCYLMRQYQLMGLLV